MSHPWKKTQDVPNTHIKTDSDLLLRNWRRKRFHPLHFYKIPLCLWENYMQFLKPPVSCSHFLNEQRQMTEWWEVYAISIFFYMSLKMRRKIWFQQPTALVFMNLSIWRHLKRDIVLLKQKWKMFHKKIFDLKWLSGAAINNKGMLTFMVGLLFPRLSSALRLKHKTQTCKHTRGVLDDDTMYCWV